jgi:hypothetical protein
MSRFITRRTPQGSSCLLNCLLELLLVGLVVSLISSGHGYSEGIEFLVFLAMQGPTYNIASYLTGEHDAILLPSNDCFSELPLARSPSPGSTT